MKIHASAPLAPKGRALMVRRVVEEGWTVLESEPRGANDVQPNEVTVRVALGCTDAGADTCAGR